MHLQEQSARPLSPNWSADQENQSPTSVLSVFPSDTLGSEDSGTPDGSTSPMSFHDQTPSPDDPMAQGSVSQLEEPVPVVCIHYLWYLNSVLHIHFVIV